MFSSQDALFLHRCLDLALKASRAVAPNPYVGSVIVHYGRIIGEGFHQQAGQPHAEVLAVRAVADPTLLKESTIYVTLEPCAHFGKTPPCADLIIRHQIPRVVIGMQDPNPKVDGGGIARMKAQGIEVVLSPDPRPFAEINHVFLTNLAFQRPFIALKWAQTADGYLAGVQTNGGSFPVRITGPQANQYTHRLRASYQGIWIGRKTAEIDNPRLNTRLYPGPNPIKIVWE